MDYQLSQLYAADWFSQNQQYSHAERFIDWVATDSDPLPPIRDVHQTGFDAIVQFKISLLNKLLDSSLGYPPYTIQINYNNSFFPIEFQRIIAERIAAIEVYAPVYSVYNNSVTRVVFEPKTIEILYGNSDIRLYQESNNVFADIKFNYEIKINASETPASLASRSLYRLPYDRYGNRRDPMQPEPMTSTLIVDSGNFTIQRCTVFTRDSIIPGLSSTLEINYTSINNIIIQNSNIVNFLNTQLRAKFIQLGNYPITKLKLARDGETQDLLNYRFFRSYLKIVGRGNKVLSVCFEANSVQRFPNLDLVVSFIGNKSYGYFTSEELIKANIARSWRRLGFNRVLTMNQSVDNNQSVATLRYELGQLNEVTFEFGSDKYPDFIAIEFTLKSRLLRLIRNGSDVTASAGDLVNEKTYINNFFVFPFDNPTEMPSNAEVITFLRNTYNSIITRNLVVYSDPSGVSNVVSISNIEGKTSTPLKCLLFLANINS